MSDWDGMEDAWLDSYWEERLSGPADPYDYEEYPQMDRLEDFEDDDE